MIRLYVGAPAQTDGLSISDARLEAGARWALPEAAARHAQVRRMQPGDRLRLFDGQGTEHEAQVLAMGRRDVTVEVGQPVRVETELPVAVTLAVAMPANERMDYLVEKATELGVARVQPLVSERSVLRLDGERARRKAAHWHAVAVAACEQCGRARVPDVAPAVSLEAWLAVRSGDPTGVPTPGPRWLLSPAPGATPLAALPQPGGPVVVLSGPEGGLTPAEEARATAAGFQAIGLGPRVLRAETAPLAVLAWIGLMAAAG